MRVLGITCNIFKHIIIIYNNPIVLLSGSQLIASSSPVQWIKYISTFTSVKVPFSLFNKNKFFKNNNLISYQMNYFHKYNNKYIINLKKFHLIKTKLFLKLIKIKNDYTKNNNKK